MIDIDKMKCAFVATPHFVQGAFHFQKSVDGGEPVLHLCALTALAVYAGLPVAFVRAASGSEILRRSESILHEAYGIDTLVAHDIVRAFDRADNVKDGLALVLKVAEYANNPRPQHIAIQSPFRFDTFQKVNYPAPAASPYIDFSEFPSSIDTDDIYAGTAI